MWSRQDSSVQAYPPFEFKRSRISRQDHDADRVLCIPYPTVSAAVYHFNARDVGTVPLASFGRASATTGCSATRQVDDLWMRTRPGRRCRRRRRWEYQCAVKRENDVI